MRRYFWSNGYLKSPEDKNKLIVDEYAAGVIQDIYKWFLEGMSKLGIVRKLDELETLPPLEYKKSIKKCLFHIHILCLYNIPDIKLK